MAGGGQIDEYWGGAYAQPRFLATWTLLAKFRRVPTVYFGVGLDQLATRMGRFLALAALGYADLLSFRDHGTYELLQSLGLRKPGNVHADPAFGLAGVPRKEFVASGRVVISPICHVAGQVRPTKSTRATCMSWRGTGSRYPRRFDSALCLHADFHGP